MKRVLPKLGFGMLAILLASGGGGCSDSLSGSQESFRQLAKPYDNTLSKSEQKAAIAELKDEAKRKSEAEEPETTASVKPAASQ